MEINAIVTNIVAAFIYDTGKAIARGTHTQTQEEALKKELNRFLKSQMEHYGEYGEAIIEALPIPARTYFLYQDVVESCANSDILLQKWMQGCKDENFEQIRATCRGCIDIIIRNIKHWPEFTTDLVLSTWNAVSELNQNMEATQSILSSLTPTSASLQITPDVNDRTSEYKERWTEPLFLNNPSKNREAKPICAKDIYIPHHYLYGNESKPSDEKKHPLISELAKYGGRLVLGDPGIGKSTLISWYLNNSTDIRTIKVYRLTDFGLSATDKQPGIFLLNKMGIKLDQLVDTILFLDGLDECTMLPEERVRFLQELFNNWRSLEKKNVSWIITCRLNYISEEQVSHLNISRITLLPLEAGQDGQIQQYLSQFEKIYGQSIPDKKKAALLSEKNVGKHGSPFGIPLILYMAVASDITITANSTLVDIYDQLFPALYKRSQSYDDHEQEIVYRFREEIHQISRDVALWMLLHCSETASIRQNVYEEIENAFSSAIASEHIHQIGSYFRALHHTEGDIELCFIHRTMYEYFVADGFVNLAIQAKTPEDLSRVISWYWYAGKMDNTMEQYVQQKLRNSKDLLNFSLWEMAGQRIIIDGIHRCWNGLYDRKVGSNNYIVPTCLFPSNGDDLEDDRQSENTAFWNLCHLLAFVRSATNYTDYIFKHKNCRKALSRAIRHCSADYFPIYCPYFSLPYSSLSRTYLSHAVLIGADLSNTHLSVADLSNSDLTRANLTKISIKDAILFNALLSRKQIQMLGYEKLASCHFDTIRIGPDSHNYVELSRKTFFKKFFPTKPYPSDK